MQRDARELIRYQLLSPRSDRAGRAEPPQAQDSAHGAIVEQFLLRKFSGDYRSQSANSGHSPQ
jgi:hypothetical protein